MRALGFDNYEGVLKVYLAKFREVSLGAPIENPIANVQAQIAQARQKQLDPDDKEKRSPDDEHDGRRKKGRAKKAK
jgi:hypothetical protein